MKTIIISTFITIVPLLFLVSFPVNGKPLNDSGLTAPETQVVVPIIQINLLHVANLMFYDNSPVDITLIYEIYCYIPPETPPGVECKVDLVGTAEGLLVSSIDPMVFTYMVDTSQFSIEVQVPPDTPAYKKLTIMISGTYEVSPGQGEGEVTPFLAEIIIPHYGCIQLSAEPLDWKPPVGHWTEVELTLMNQANAEDVLTLDLFEYDPKVEVRFSKDILKLRMGEYTKVSMAARQKNGLPGTNRFTIRARSAHQGLNDTRYCEISFETMASPKSFLSGPLLYFGGGSLLLLVILTAIIIGLIVRRRRKARNSHLP